MLRLLKNLIAPMTLADVLGEGGASLISKAVGEAESRTSGEIVVRIVQSVGKVLPRNAAIAEFDRLGIRGTSLRSGILLFITLDEHAIELVADDGIAAVVPQETWDVIVEIISLGFRTGFSTEVVVMAVMKIGDLLSAHFPYCSTDQNELPNEVCTS